MKMQSIAIVLTIVNLVIMTLLLAQIHVANAQDGAQTISPVLRGRAFELVDSLGRVRASLTLQPPVEAQGKKYTQTVLLRLIASNGKPMVKLGASEDGSGLTLINQSDEGIIINGRDDGSSITISHKGKEQVIKP